MNKVSGFIQYWLLKIPVYQRYVFNREKKKIKSYTKQIEDDILRASLLLKRVNARMVAAGWPRARRKQFWKDFYKSDQFREDVFDDLVKMKLKENDSH